MKYEVFTNTKINKTFMSKKTIIIAPLISLLLFSCSNSTSQKEHQHNTETQIIELNNGEKWKVDDTMLVHIRNMENDVQTFTIAEEKNYTQLADKLQKNIDLLTSNCTMKGKAHDELHKWLLPYIDLVKQLSETQDETEAAKQFQNIQTSFTTFNQYFQ
jgi:septal ring factor EnvC (AmiA/AmiB activator)